MTAFSDRGHEQLPHREKKKTLKATVPIKGCFAQRVSGMRENLPRETEGVASAQSWTQHLFQEPGHISARTGPGCKYLCFCSHTICLWLPFRYRRHYILCSFKTPPAKYKYIYKFLSNLSIHLSNHDLKILFHSLCAKHNKALCKPQDIY